MVIHGLSLWIYNDYCGLENSMNLADVKKLFIDDIEYNTKQWKSILKLILLLSLTNSAYRSSSDCSESKVQRARARLLCWMRSSLVKNGPKWYQMNLFCMLLFITFEVKTNDILSSWASEIQLIVGSVALTV